MTVAAILDEKGRDVATASPGATLADATQLLGARKIGALVIVEDNDLNMKLFQDLLEAHDIDTIPTRDGQKVVDIARENQPDLILMDIQLPEISGLDVTALLKQEDDLKHIPVIAVTAFAMKGDEEKIRSGGCEDYLSKPISVMRFLEVSFS